jgi:PAS domain S-box-containing protein
MLPSPSKAEELLRMNETIHGERTVSEPQDRVIELLEQQTAISEVLRAIASSPHDLQPVFDAILDSATRLCRADIGSLRISEESGLRRVAVRGDPLLVSQAWSSFPVLAEKGSFLSRLAARRLPTQIPDLTALEGENPYAGFRTGLVVPLLKDNEVVGIITLARKQVQPFTDKQISLFRDFAAQATIALDSTRLELRTSEERWRSLLNNPIFGVTFLDENHRFIATSRTFQNMVGYSDEELRQLTPLDISVPGEREINENFFSQMRQGKRQHYEMIKRLLCKNGNLIWIHLYVFAITDRKSGTQLPFGIVFDITEKKQAQDALLETRIELTHANRVATMGQLTASIAHEIKQPIASSRNNAAAALRFLDKSPPDVAEAREALTCIVNDADRASDVVDRIGSLIKKAPPRREVVDLNAAILEVTALTHSEAAKTGVTVGTQLAGELPRIQGDRVQLLQVMLNLIVNAIQSMSGVEDGNRELHISTVSIEPEGVCVAVRDTGHGLRPESLPRLFEPFFTTKPDGMGMGLSICRSIIEAHGGRLWATGCEPRGALFQFTIPAD